MVKTKFYVNYERILNTEKSEKFGISMLKKKKYLEFLQKMCMSFKDNLWKFLENFKEIWRNLFWNIMFSRIF